MTGVLIHEWVADIGGSERVLDEFARLYPAADMRVLWTTRRERYEGRALRESWLARTPLKRSKAIALPFMLPTWRLMPSRGARYDWALVSSHLFAHHARFIGQPDVPKLVYTHTPARYIWSPEHDDRGSGIGVRTASAILRPIDRRRASEAAAIAANSKFTASRVRQFWDRDAQVIYPPVDTERILAVHDWSTQLSDSESELASRLPDAFLLGASRLVPYKRLDHVVRAAAELDVPAVIAGDGPDRARLEAVAENSGARVTFVGRTSDELLFSLYQKCIAYVFPSVEDFGIMPVEAIAAGAPVIVGSTGGAAESVSSLGGGAVVDRFEGASLREGVETARRVDRVAARTRASTFSATRFREEIDQWKRAALMRQPE